MRRQRSGPRKKLAGAIGARDRALFDDSDYRALLSMLLVYWGGPGFAVSFFLTYASLSALEPESGTLVKISLSLAAAVVGDTFSYAVAQANGYGRQVAKRANRVWTRS